MQVFPDSDPTHLLFYFLFLSCSLVLRKTELHHFFLPILITPLESRFEKCEVQELISITVVIVMSALQCSDPF